MTARLKILVLEDENVDYQLLQRQLQASGLGYRARRVACAIELESALQDPDWDLVITDYTLPDIDIQARLGALRQAVPEAPIIMLSGTIGEELAVEFLKAGIEDFVSKDNPGRLLPAIERALRDRSDRRAKERAEHELRASEARLREAQQVAQIGNWELDARSGEAHWSDQIYHMFELDPDQPAGADTLQKVIHPEDWPRLDAVLTRALSEAEPFQIDYRVRRGADRYIWINCQARPVTNAAGQVERIAGVVQDITARRDYEQRLLQSAKVFESTADGVFITDADNKVIDVNRAFTAITGFTAEDVVGKDPGYWKSGRHDESFFRDMWQELRKTGTWRGEIWNRRKDGSVLPEWMTISAVHDNDGHLTNYVAVFSDISSIKRSEAQLEHMAHYDTLTDLPNRLLLQARLNHAISHAQRHRSQVAVIFLDLDRFKNVNDSLGHPVGDELLRRVAGRLRHCVRQDDTVARIGGDEFVLLLESIEHAENAAVIAAKVQHAFNKVFDLQEHSVHISASMGICTYPDDGLDADTLLRNADAAMYRAKDEGRNTYRYYTEELTEHAFERVVMEGQLREALHANDLYMVYQPQIDLLSGKVVGVEALMRWQSREFGMVSPRRFIPIAEESGLINELGEYALNSALHQASEWYRQGIDFGRMAINIAGTQLRHPDFIDVFFHQLEGCRLPPELLELEITEDFIMHEADKAVADLQRLQELGVGIAIDDFGTGYSSLAYLKQLPIGKLKIDQSFIQDVPRDSNDMAITRTIIALGRIMQLQVVAEGVETDAQRDFLISEGCDQAQGYLFAHAGGPQDVERWLRQPSALVRPH